MNLRRELETRIGEALASAGAPRDTAALVAVSTRPEFGDYQANGVMPAAGRLKTNPRKLAESVLEKLDLSDIAEKVEIAGPGFLNVRLKDDFLGKLVSDALSDERLGVQPPQRAGTVVVDYSGPNLAKEMHVGHLRSTIIGDALARVLQFVGHRVIRQNHVGDWGTQFGMLIERLKEEIWEKGQALIEAGSDRGFTIRIQDMEQFYIEAKTRFDEDPEFRRRASENVVKLQQGDESIYNHWGDIFSQSLQHCEQVYRRLGVKLTREDVRGESAYNDDLPKVIEALDAACLLAESQGAQGVYLDEFTNKLNERAFVIVRKSDGGYLYATTDLAAIRYRVGELKADRILYVTDSRQELHFKQLFAIARKASFASGSVSLEHVGFGMMLDASRRPFKTRQGGTVKLTDLLAQAVARARELVESKNPHLPDDQKDRIAEVVGIGAVKYADLSQNRASDYVFSWDKMLSLDGNTAPYMQYAYARIRSIFRKAGTGGAEIRNPQSAIRIIEPAERKLALQLVRFPEAIATVAAECLPNVLCGYLYELAGAFMGFYESCPVLQADGEAIRTSRLALCELAARTIRRGLELLGIETVERM